MLVEVLRGKIHKATVNQVDLDYIGSLSLDEKLMEAAGLTQYEKVLVSNLENGERFETYVIKTSKGVVGVNGAAAHLAKKGDKIIVMAFGFVESNKLKTHKPKIVLVDESNKVIKVMA